MGDFSHLSASGEAAMVDISGKGASVRTALVRGTVRVSEACAQKLTGDAVLEIIRTARVAGIQAAKQTHMLVPLCHQIALAGVDVMIEFAREDQTFALSARAKTMSATGVEMEALVAAQIAGTTIYDMIKAVDPAAVVGPFALYEKDGGKNGAWRRSKDQP
jgi:cyclic pyranopterin phosphate synthase